LQAIIGMALPDRQAGRLIVIISAIDETPGIERKVLQFVGKFRADQALTAPESKDRGGGEFSCDAHSTQPRMLQQ